MSAEIMSPPSLTRWWDVPASSNPVRAAATPRMRECGPLEAPTRRHALRDALTGLGSRQALIERIARLQQRPAGRDVALIVASIDEFQALHDTLGHDVADWFLRAQASRLRDAVSPLCMLARTGNDEFALLLDGVCGADEAMAVARCIADKLALPVTTSGGRVAAAASVGVVLPGDAAGNEHRLLEQAGIALACARSHGGGALRCFEAGMLAQRSRSFALNQAIHSPEIEQQLALNYQTVVDLASGQVCGMEALLRWHLPEGGQVTPAEFIPLAERGGAILRLGAWALRQACEQMAVWRRAGLHAVPVAVNLSPRQLAQPDFVDSVFDTLDATGLPAECMHLEITETAAMGNDDAVEKLTSLADRGVRLAIDDFGTGYSCLSRLQALPIHTLKIDRSFVSRMDAGARDVAVVASIVSLARSLHMDTIAEGVETQGQADLLRALGCDRVQGYLFSRPLDGLRAGQLLRAA
jgi:diguanylate cyclase (GGDEF)-like protein